MAEFSTIIKDGMVFDGARNPRVRTDVGIKDGIITAMGHLRASDADQVIDASGLHVAPGFIDSHTHYDAQLFWDPYCSLSGWHGVTSLTIGNCGYAFAPVAPEYRERAMLMMTRNEAMSMAAMQQGMPWDWITYPEFLDSVERTPKSVNILPYVGLSPLMLWVMGLDDAKSGRMPTDSEHAEMAKLLHEAMDAGACGFSMHYAPGDENVQRDHDGTPMITDVMNQETMEVFARVLEERHAGTIEMTLGTPDPRTNFALTERMAEVSGRPVIWNAIFVEPREPAVHRMFLGWLRSCLDRGLPIYGQGVTSHAPTIFTLEDWNLWDTVPAWREALIGTPAERLANVKAQYDVLVANPPTNFGTGRIEELVLVETFTPEYKQFEGKTFGDVIAATGKDRVAAVLDIAIADELRTVIKSDNLRGGIESHREIIDYPYVLPGQSDGGAHTKFITFGRYPTEYLTTFVRDRAWLSLEEAHWRLSAYPAKAAGMHGRGVIREGAAADIVVYDYEKLEILPHEVLHDVPGGDWRRVQKAKGYRHVLVNGEVTIEDDQQTDVASGQLLRWGGEPSLMQARARGEDAVGRA
jgi:N-acyl-D-aspartate/D-glutamate deacylase